MIALAIPVIAVFSAAVYYVGGSSNAIHCSIHITERQGAGLVRVDPEDRIRELLERGMILLKHDDIQLGGGVHLETAGSTATVYHNDNARAVLTATCIGDMGTCVLTTSHYKAPIELRTIGCDTRRCPTGCSVDMRLRYYDVTSETWKNR